MFIKKPNTSSLSKKTKFTKDLEIEKEILNIGSLVNKAYLNAKVKVFKNKIRGTTCLVKEYIFIIKVAET